MGWGARLNDKERVFIAFPNDDLRSRFDDFQRRTEGALKTIRTFMNEMSEMDEEAPDLTEQCAPVIEKLMTEMVLNYPTPDHLEADLETLSIVKKDD